MIQKSIEQVEMPKKVKKILKVLQEKAEVKNCVDETLISNMVNATNWHTLPAILDDALEALGVNTGRNDRTVKEWLSVPDRIDLLQTKVDELDCRSLAPILESDELVTVEGTLEEVEEVKETEEVAEEVISVSRIKLVEFNADEDLKGELEEVNLTAYFEDKSGDEVPNIGKKLYKNKALTKPLEGYKGAFYFTNSKSDDKITMLLRGTGTVKKTKFEV